MRGSEEAYKRAIELNPNNALAHMWYASAIRERDYEGANLPLRASQRGIAMQPMRELRDPAVFEDDGKTYLLYSVAGEHGIAIAQLTFSTT